MKLKTKLSKLRHEKHITDAEYAVIINVINKFSTQPPKTQTCEDCISRQAAIDVVRKWFDKIQLNGDICLDGIISLPPVTPQQETGKWIKEGEEEDVVGFRWTSRRCSKCGWTHCLVIPNNYCPNCGAKMEVANDE